MSDPAAGGPPPADLLAPEAARWLTGAIERRALRAGLQISSSAVDALVVHASRVARRNDLLHLTSIVRPEEFLERHIGESLEGAAMLPGAIEGVLLDLGSGNGYPGLPVAAARPGLRPVLAEASARKAAFLGEVVEEAFPGGAVLNRQIQRADDLETVLPVHVVVTRAAGGWERILPRLARAMPTGGRLLVWAGEELDRIADRKVWQRYRLLERRPLPGRDRSWIWGFETNP